MKFSLFILLSLLVGSQAYASTVIKFATVAPEGSSWMDVLKEAGNKIKDQTKGRVEFRYYPGGIAGDEPDVLRKMRAGQYHGAGFTGVGLGEILPELRIMELPFFFKNLAEIDYIKEKITPEFKNKFNGKGYVFLGWAEPGLVYLFAQKPIKSASDMTGVKLWAWEGDPLADAMIKAFKVTPVHISLPDVLMALQTGMLTAVYAPPMAAMALQWHTKVKYMMNEPLTNSTGGALVTKKQWDKISAEDQATVMSVFKSSLDELTIATRKQNVESIDKFKELGIKIDSLSKLGFQEMTAAAAEIRPQLVGKLYSADLLKRVESLLSDLRKNKKSK
ncbi:MAG: hypothetical protein A3K03_02365 [Bdellovibrionales bacterium RIFOXYD1_FULL_44_7]|nr:MAG: hypothetical protein A3K03_02365 [Bdellovibrionales bacterium RIFOXYD1_FULL_44_7]